MNAEDQKYHLAADILAIPLAMVPTSGRLKALCMAKALRTVVAASVKGRMGAEVRGGQDEEE